MTVSGSVKIYFDRKFQKTTEEIGVFFESCLKKLFKNYIVVFLTQTKAVLTRLWHSSS